MATGFLIIPFAEEFAALSDDLKAAVRSCGHELHRLDDRHADDWLSLRLRRQLDTCDFAVVVLTGENPNVMWETGYVMAQRKPVLALSTEPESHSADVRGFTMVHYDPSDGPALRDRIRECLPAVLGSGIGGYSRIWIASLMRTARKAVAAVLKGEPDFEDEGQYVQHLASAVRQLSPGERVRAVCGKKNWSSAWVKQYFDVNGRAAASGVDIERVFVLTDPHARRAAEEHVLLGISVRVLDVEQLSSLVTAAMPPHLGFAILREREVVVHWDDGGIIRGSHFLDVGNVQQFCRIYAELRELSRPVSAT